MDELCTSVFALRSPQLPIHIVITASGSPVERRERREGEPQPPRQERLISGSILLDSPMLVGARSSKPPYPSVTPTKRLLLAAMPFRLGVQVVMVAVEDDLSGETAWKLGRAAAPHTRKVTHLVYPVREAPLRPGRASQPTMSPRVNHCLETTLSKRQGQLGGQDLTEGVSGAQGSSSARPVNFSSTSRS